MEYSFEKISEGIEKTAAAEVADWFLSPFVDADLLCKATEEPGPAMWIVNRSDVYNETLESLKNHPQPQIAERAREKLMLRASSLQLLSPPLIETPYQEIPEWEVEDILGHPLVPFEAIVYFSQSLIEEQRATSALSLMRRLLEHPPRWDAPFERGQEMKAQLQQVFANMLTQDSSEYVRSYAARVPILSNKVLAEALESETHPYVAARILQNPALSVDALIKKNFSTQDAPSIFFNRVKALDSRLPAANRVALIAQPEHDPLSCQFHRWYLQRIT